MFLDFCLNICKMDMTIKKIVFLLAQSGARFGALYVSLHGWLFAFSLSPMLLDILVKIYNKMQKSNVQFSFTLGILQTNALKICSAPDITSDWFTPSDFR